MEREDLLTLVKSLLEQSMSDGLNYDFALVEDGLLFGRVPMLRVVTKTHDEFVVRVEEV